MRAPSELQRAGLLLRAIRHGEYCAPEQTIDAEQGDAYAVSWRGTWYLYFVDRGRFHLIARCESIKAVQRLCPTAYFPPPAHDVRLPVPPPAQGKGRYKRPTHKAAWQ